MSSDDDDLTNDIAAAFESAEAPAPKADEAPVAVAPEAEKPAASSERARDETGKFTKQPDAEKSAAPDKKELVSTGTATSAQQQAPVTPIPAATRLAPPTNWKGNGKVAWDRLPQDIQKELSDDYTRFTETQGKLEKLQSAIGERSTVLAAQYGSVENGLQNLFAISDFATKNPEGFLLWYAQQRGLNLAQLVQGNGQGQQPTQEPHPLEKEVLALKSQLQQLTQAEQTKGTAQLQSEIDRFAQDAAHPYFNDVRAIMAGLMNTGEAKTLQEAYDQAVWARPDIRGTLLEQERKKALEANAAIVTAAKQRAGSSITGSPRGAKPPDDEPDEDLEATIRRSVDRAFAA